MPAGGLVSLMLDWLMDIGLVNRRCKGELLAQAATPYLGDVPDCDGATLPVRAVDVVVTPLIMHRLLELCTAHAASYLHPWDCVVPGEFAPV